MNVKFWVKFVCGLLSVIALIVACVLLADYFSSLVTNLLSGGDMPIGEEGDYVIPTDEPMPTMPDYIGEDSFYDNAGMKTDN